MLTYYACLSDDMGAIDETLHRDSQAGTQLSRETLGKVDKTLADKDRDELLWHLANHGRINSAEFEVPHTLKLM